MKNILIIILIYTCSINAQASIGWKLIKNKHNIEIFTLQKPGYKLKHYQAKTTVDRDMGTILAVLQDTELCQQWVYQCVSNKMIEMIDIRKRIYHTIINAPLWFKDREFFVKSSVKYDKQKKALEISFDSQPHYQNETTNKILINQINMIWRLTFLDKDKTAITYQIYIDPELPIKTINNMIIKKSIFHTLSRLKEIINNSEYSKYQYTITDFEMLADDNN